MDIHGRQELRKAYEELADEVLIEISQNTNQEYEAAAVETAKVVLDERGVNASYINDKLTGKSGSSGAVIEGPSIEIPRFSADETAAIEEIFNENRLPYEIHEAATASCSGCGCNEYVFHVPEESFSAAVEILRDYYLSGVEEGAAADFSGTCPACGTELVKVEACTDCGLTLSVGHSASLENHPFIKFLKQNNLLA